MGRRSRKPAEAPSRHTLTADEMKSMVSAAYYSAASDAPAMDWSFARKAGFNQALFTDLDKLRTRARYELRQNGLAKGLARIYANSCVGTGPMLTLACSDRAWAKSVEIAYTSWSKQCGHVRGESLGMLIHLGVRQMFPVGEFILLPRSDPKSKNPVKLKLLMIRPDRVKSPEGQQSNILQGIEVDGDGKPVAHHIQQQDADTVNGTVVEKIMRVPVEKVIHVFYVEDPAQLRGEPWFTQMLPNFHKLRRFDDATIAAAIVAAKFAAVLVNKNADAGATAEILPPAVLEISDGMMMVPPPGYEPMQIQPQHPSANQSEFRREVIGGAGAAAGIPVNIATQDSSKSSFASARFDGVSFLEECSFMHEVLASLGLNPAFYWWLNEAIAASVVPPPADDLQYAPFWRWPKSDRHTDPSKAASAKNLNLSNGILTVADAVLDEGKDPDQHFEALDSELAWYHKHNLKHPMEINSQGSTNEPQTTQDPPADDQGGAEA